MDTETKNDQDTIAGKKPNRRKEILSKDGKWKSFPKVRHLLQYVSTGTYFARVRVNGNLKRQSLDTDVFTTAELRLADFIKQEKGLRLIKGDVLTFKDARLRYLHELETDTELAETSKRYRRFCVKALAESWPELDAKKIHSIKNDECEKWAAKFRSEKDAQYFNNILGSFRGILKLAGRVGAHDPTREIKRRGVVQTLVDMPTLEQFGKVLTEIETSKHNRGKYCADLVRFLAFSGCRLSEAKGVRAADVDLAGGWIKVKNAKRRRSRDAKPGDVFRSVPIVGEMRQLLERILPKDPQAPVCRVHECEASLTRACAKVGVARLTHHDLRHYFITVCVEKGVDSHTISKWVGHRDGGALVLKVYANSRDEHSQDMAAKVNFGTNGGAK